MTQTPLFAVALDRLEVKNRGLALGLALVTGSLLLFASSRMTVEIGVLPITMQSIAAIALGLVLGSRLGAAAAFLYFLECLAMPGFSARPMVMTGGYVLGFVFAAYIAGALYERGHGRSLLKALLASIPANLVIFAVGIPWLAIALGFDMKAAWLAGGAPFIMVEALKIGLGVLMLRGLGLLQQPRA